VTVHPKPPFRDLSSPGPHDRVELKWDGIWLQLDVADGRAIGRSCTGTVKLDRPAGNMPDMTIVGEYLVGTTWSSLRRDRGHVRAFDLLAFQGEDVIHYGLLWRRALLAFHLAVADLGWLTITESHPASAWQNLWARHVENGDWEGLVFKSSHAPYGEPWGRLKREVTADYVCMGFNPGAGRYAGMAGSIRSGLYIDGKLREVCSVGSGLCDHARAAMTVHPERFVGRIFEARGAARFKSGALRHASFVRWRPDKTPEMCM
jgi:ATP-dependent DNA ligase